MRARIMVPLLFLLILCCGQSGSAATQETQVATVTVRTCAMVPIHLEMCVQVGREGTKLEGWGSEALPKAIPVTLNLASASNQYLLGWMPITPEGKKAGSGSGQGTHVKLLETVRTVLWSNSHYTYTVNVGAGGRLWPKGGGTGLPVTMRAFVRLGAGGDQEGQGWREYEFSGLPIRLLEADPLQTVTVFHEFRAPLDQACAANRYSGELVFAAACL